MEKLDMLELIQNDEYKTNIYKVGAFRFPSSYKFEFHNHDEIEINYVASGCCLMEIDDNVVSLKKGDCIIIYSNTPHSFMVNLDQSCRLMQLEVKIDFPKNHYNNEFIKELQNEKIKYRKCFDCEFIENYIGIIYRYKNNDKFKLRQNDLINLQLLALYEELSEKIKIEKEKVENKSDKFSQIIKFINENYREQINIEDLCVKYDISSRYIRKKFNNEIGMSCSRYINTLRVNKAKDLLYDLNLTITEIASLTGFVNSQYFCRVFKKYTNLSPANYRQLDFTSKK